MRLKKHLERFIKEIARKNKIRTQITKPQYNTAKFKNKVGQLCM